MANGKRLLIRGGLVYDGSGSAPWRADVLVRAGRIEAVAPGLAVEDAELLEAAGCAVTPGFIDMHRHADAAVFRDADFGTLELAQGITAAIVGNCGLAPVPAPEAWRAEAAAFLSPILGELPQCPAFAAYHAYRQALEGAALPIHLGFLAGSGAIRTAAQGFSVAPLTPDALRRMVAWAEQAMEAGAFGLSMGLMYPPECHASRRELLPLLRVAARHGGLVCTHIRGEGDSLPASIEEVIALAREAELPLHISHLKATGRRNWRSAIFAALERIERANDEGLRVTADGYPYDAGASTLASLLPPGLVEEGGGWVGLDTPGGRRRVREALSQPQPGWDNMAASIGWERVLVSAGSLPEHAALSGRDMASLAAERGLEPSDLLCRLLAESGGRMGAVLRSMDASDVEEVLRAPFTAVISDALYGGGSHPHPRLYGAFPRFLRRYVVERKLLPMELAVHKLTGLPSRLLRLADRGLLRPGYAADVCVFRPEEIGDHADYARPRQLSTGMRYVLVGGRTAWRDESRTGAAQGAALRPESP